MAHIAFDLDNTLGFFELTNPLAQFWSPEFIANPEQGQHNSPLRLSPTLQRKLARARATFAKFVAADANLYRLVIRANIDAMMGPILTARRRHKLRAVIIYSNTSVTYSMELAKAVIERKFRAHDLFRLMADHWHPARTADGSAAHSIGRPAKYVEPLKTIETLQKLFRYATHSRRHIPIETMAFVDDRQPKHELAAQEPAGLTYIVPTRYYPSPVTAQDRRDVLDAAIEALDVAGLLDDEEYLHSAICYREIPYDWNKRLSVRGFPDLYAFVKQSIDAVQVPRAAWQDDSWQLSSAMERFLERV